MPHFLVGHAYALVFGVTLLEQLGLPLPAAPMLLAAGALARSGQINGVVALALALIAALAGHTAWFYAGRLGGTRVLKLLCSISLEPDSCVRRTQEAFAERGAITLIVAPWIPGLGGVAPPLAGTSPMRLTTFLLLDGIGSLFYSGVFVAIGFIFGDQLATLLAFGARFGVWFAAALAAALALYILIKFRERRRVLRDLALTRITPHEVKRLIEGGGELLIVDVRHASELTGGTLPGALALSFEELAARAETMPRDRDVILYCS